MLYRFLMIPKDFFKFITACFFISCSAQEYKDVAPQDFNRLINEKGGVILDVRTNGEIATGALKDASTIDYYDVDFKNKISKIQKDKTVYVYCKSGGRSSRAAKLLIEAGQNEVINLKGGIMAWKRAGLPLSNIKIKKDDNIKKISINQFDNILSSNSLVLIDFHTLWCVPCRKLSPIIDELEKEYKGKIEILRVDIDISKDLANYYSINSVPTLLMFDRKKQIWRNTGLITKKELEQKIINLL